jgi:hypothetical protein
MLGMAILLRSSCLHPSGSGYHITLERNPTADPHQREAGGR